MSRRLLLLDKHIEPAKTLFKGPIEKFEQVYDKERSKLNLDAAIKLYSISQQEKEF